MEDRRMSTNSREPSEQEIEALRESLLNGGFGEEACEDSAEEADFAREDDEAVKRFKAMFGAKGPTPLKGYDWRADVPGSMLDSGVYGPIHGILREETQSVYVFDSPVAGSTEETTRARPRSRRVRTVSSWREVMSRES